MKKKHPGFVHTQRAGIQVRLQQFCVLKYWEGKGQSMPEVQSHCSAVDPGADNTRQHCCCLSASGFQQI